MRRAKQLTKHLVESGVLELVVSGDNGKGPFGTETALRSFLKQLNAQANLADDGKPLQPMTELPDSSARRDRQIHQLDRHNQFLLSESKYVRQEFFWSKLNYDSLDKFQDSIEPFRNYFADEIIGRFDLELSAPNPRSRQIAESEKWIRYEVVLDVYPDVIAYGILTIPRSLKPGSKCPVVVCQHGLEGRPQDVIGKSQFEYYKAFATALAERGYITFAPQNLYRGQDRFRTLQRKVTPLRKTLFSIIAPQHQQIVTWLKSLPQADSDRIAFYGLSYGGKTAMRVPPLVADYCLSICSGDFNEWIDKVASSRAPYSYVPTGEYEIFEFNLGNTFNYAEMAALICPRPFMVERGHFDTVGDDQMVAGEYAKVRHLYAARLKIPHRTEIEWFLGPHTINGQGSFQFLDKHLK